MQRPTDDRFIIGRGELLNRIAVMMGGRAAEELVFNEISTGAVDDLDRATDIARQMVARFGMAEALGQRVYEPQRQAFLGETIIGTRPKDYSDETNREIDVAVRRLVDDAYEKAKATLVSRRKELEEGTALLLQKETITPADYPPLQGKSAAEELLAAAR
jgi:cell division protease FtsH